jgi:hypothetical protein
MLKNPARLGASSSEAGVRRVAFVKQFFSRYTLAGAFLNKVRQHWADMMMGGGLSGVALFVLSSLFGLSHYLLLLVFVGAFCFGSYATWRDEYLKSSTKRMIGRITKMAFVPVQSHSLAVVTVEISNGGPQTAIRDWNARYANSQGAHSVVLHGAFETASTLEDQSGDNLIHDKEVIEQGGIRAGWLAFHISREDQARILNGRVDKNISFTFADAFGTRYPVTMLED